jgi:hypothetical protein
VLRLAKAGVADDLIITQVKRNGKAFDLNTDEIVALGNAGISKAVIEYLLDPSRPYSPPPPPPSAAAASSGVIVAPAVVVPPKPPSDLRALKVPPEPGIYYFKGPDEFVPLDLKPVVPSKQPGKISSLLTKGHIIGSLIGPSAKARALGSPLLFFVRIGEKMMVDDLALLRLETSSKRRDLDFGKKAGKPVFQVSAVKQFESKEVAPGMFRLTVAMAIKPGEYVFFILGSGDDKKAQLGKAYDFGVD